MTSISTRNRIIGFVAIPILKLSYNYAINKEGTIIRFPSETVDTQYDVIYEWREKTSETPIEFKFQDEIIPLTPISLYMLTYYGYCKLDIMNSPFADKCKYIVNDVQIDGDECLIDGDVFKRVKSLPTYFINEYGCAFNSRTYSIAKQNFKYKEYNYKAILKIGVHRMVYEAWVGDLLPGHEIHHKDDTDWNNYYANLEQLTRPDHMINHGENLFDKETIHAICKDLVQGMHIYESAKKNNVSPYVVESIYRGKSHKDISSQYTFPEIRRNSFSRKLSEQDVREICELFQEYKLTNKEIGEIYNVAKDTICDIRRRRSFRNITSEYTFSTLDVGQTEESRNKNIESKSKRNASITEEQVIQIWRDLQTGMMVKVVAEKNGVSKNIVSKIRQRYRWSSVTDKLGPLPSDM